MTNEKIMSTICDSICRHPYRVESQAELDILCEDCVVNKLEASDGDLISRADAIEAVAEMWMQSDYVTENDKESFIRELAEKLFEDVPSASVEVGEWIPVSERLPKELEAVNVTWVNHNPPVYYQNIKDVPKADTAVYYRGAWYWWDATVIDLLGEYGGAYIHGIEPIDKDVEVTAWMPLPKPYEGSESDDV